MTPQEELKRMDLPWLAVCARRLARHGLAKPVMRDRLAEQVGVICGAHAQVMSAAELSIGLRVAGATRTSVKHELWTERSLVKTYGPRGTVHLLPACALEWRALGDASPVRRVSARCAADGRADRRGRRGNRGGAGRRRADH